MITTRQAKPSDAERLAALNHGFNGVERHPDRVFRSLLAERSPETVVVAEEAGAAIGFLCFQTLHSMCYDQPWVEITELYVAPAHRGRGCGAALVREAQVRAEKAGASEILVRTNSRNHSAQRLFRRTGLQPAHHAVYRRSYAGAV